MAEAAAAKAGRKKAEDAEKAERKKTEDAEKAERERAEDAEKAKTAARQRAEMEEDMVSIQTGEMSIDKEVPPWGPEMDNWSGWGPPAAIVSVVENSVAESHDSS